MKGGRWLCNILRSALTTGKTQADLHREPPSPVDSVVFSWQWRTRFSCLDTRVPAQLSKQLQDTHKMTRDTSMGQRHEAARGISGKL